MKPTDTSHIDEFRFGDANAAAAELADEVASLLADDIARHGEASLAVSGGRSPAIFFEHLSRRRLDWEKVSVTLVDERWVPPESMDSNEHLVRSHLLHNAATFARFVPLKTPAPHPSAAIAERTAALAALRKPYAAIVLGMGQDGHTASLFPGAVGLEGALDPTSDARLVAIEPPHAPHPRLSFTLRALLETRRIGLLLAGADKLEIYRRALREASPLEMPIASVLRHAGVPIRVYWHA